MSRGHLAGAAAAAIVALGLGCVGARTDAPPDEADPSGGPGHDAFEIYDSEAFVMSSTNVGDDFLIAVSLPASYGTGEQS